MGAAARFCKSCQLGPICSPTMQQFVTLASGLVLNVNAIMLIHPSEGLTTKIHLVAPWHDGERTLHVGAKDLKKIMRAIGLVREIVDEPHVSVGS